MPGQDSASDRSARGRREGGIGPHLKRYGPFYAIAAVIALVVVVLPQLGGDDEETAVGSSDTPSTTEAEDDGDVGDGDAGEGDEAWSPASGDIEGGTGTTRSGEACGPGVLQLPDTEYAAPCLPSFEGDNGGTTSPGVTADTIKIVFREFPTTANSEALDQGLVDAGFATDDQSDEIRDQFIEYLNDSYELYGRQVEFITYESRFGNGTQEALGQGREGACQDATLIAEEIGAFGVFEGSGVFSECAAERGLMVFRGGAYYSEDFYQRLHPYVWHTTPGCERISAHLGEYVVKRLAGKPASFAKSPDLQEKVRKFGVYVPDNEEYQRCADQTATYFEANGLEGSTRISYALDISRFADQAARAIVQFKADGVTTINTSSDPFSIIFLTQAATEQDYYPEWLITGSAGHDTNNFGRSYDQGQVEGSMFGLSQLSASEKVFGTDSEPAVLYRKLFGEEILGGTTGDFFSLVQVFNFLQAAGPDLTPENVATGVQSLPPAGGPDDAVGLRWWGERADGEPGGDHTGLDDAREVYWDADAMPGIDEVDQEARGAFVETYDGRRFTPGEWPEEDPPVFPGG